MDYVWAIMLVAAAGSVLWLAVRQWAPSQEEARAKAITLMLFQMLLITSIRESHSLLKPAFFACSLVFLVLGLWTPGTRMLLNLSSSRGKKKA
jgi:hypothetical protein